MVAIVSITLNVYMWKYILVVAVTSTNAVRPMTLKQPYTVGDSHIL